jgi:hypothetical protein
MTSLAAFERCVLRMGSVALSDSTAAAVSSALRPGSYSYFLQCLSGNPVRDTMVPGHRSRQA